MRVTFPVIIIGAALSCVAHAADPTYNQDVRPILSEKCYACHGPDASNRKAALRLDLEDAAKATLDSGNRAIVPGDVIGSALIQRITHSDPDERMPPVSSVHSLNVDEIATLTTWIEKGAVWERHWAFEPLSNPVPPQSDDSWVRNPVDAFVLAAQQAQGLAPSPEADRRTLIRRLYFDLTGLPPTLEAVEAFVDNPAPDAYEAIVEELLASPRYGERWARHWLDVAHYGETHGYEKDKARRNAWPYRDYVIEAFNSDKPYGEFVREQIAGDVLDPNDPVGIVATGFLAAGPWDFVGHVELREGTKDKRITRVLDRDDVVGSTMNAFTSLTIQCARCHDHKFDPIAQREYYGLQAVFAGVERTDRPYLKDPEDHARFVEITDALRGLLAEKDAIAGAEAKIDTPELQRVDVAITALRERAAKLDPGDGGSPNNGYHSAISAVAKVEKWAQVDLGSETVFDAIVLVPARPVDFADTPGFGFPPRFVVQVANEADFSDAVIVADHREVPFENPGDTAVTFDAPDTTARHVRVTATELWERADDFVFALAELQVRRGERNLALGATVTARDTIDAGRWSTRNLVDGYDSRKALQDTQSAENRRLLRETRDAITKQESLRRSLVDKALGLDVVRAREETGARIKELEAARDALPKPEMVFAAAADFKPQGSFTPSPGPREVFVLARGDVDQPLEPAVPGALQCVPGVPDSFAGIDPEDEGARRAALAQWITAREHPLTWRSIVNRVWGYHFGRGIVDTPNDFGAMGTPPTHPELLDWLARAFLENGQSLKWLHRQIVCSATWRQAVAHDAQKANLDASNRYLWRMNRRPLDAESFHDSLLMFGGKLDTTMGGPSYEPFVFEDDHTPRYLYQEFDVKDPSAMRRSIYRFIVRSVPNPFMETLDCADPSQSVPVRNETLTALQALTALNNPFVISQSRHFAERLEALSPSPSGRLRLAYAFATGQVLSDGALTRLRGYEREHGLANTCRLILNSNAFMFVD